MCESHNLLVTDYYQSPTQRSRSLFAMLIFDTNFDLFMLDINLKKKNEYVSW